jgi:hypothetical protein
MGNGKVIDEGELSESEKRSDENVAGVNKTNISLWQKFRDRKALFNIVRFIFIFICSLLVTISLILFIFYIVPEMQESLKLQKSGIKNDKELRKDPYYKKRTGLLIKDIKRLSLKVNSYTSGQSYIVVNTTENRFYLYKNKQLIREGSCSTGSYKKLQTESGKSWTFKTPRGKFTIQGKRTHPAWHRPDWSFIEEGAPIPPGDSPLRWEAGVLGDYAMDLGDSYMIHGTIYKRFLGMPVTHGCVRLNDEDLEVVFNTLNIGSKVYIF